MDHITTLYNAARLYCRQRAANWHEQYSTLHASGRATNTTPTGSWTYTEEAYRVFPRYNALDAIGHEIECFVPSDFTSLENARELLSLAAQTAQSPFTMKLNEIARAVTDEERRLFAEHIGRITPEQCSLLPLLPFRRILSKGEHENLSKEFTKKWGKWYGGCVDTQEDLPQHVTIHVAAMKPDSVYLDLRDVIAQHGASRVFELREWGDGLELDLPEASFKYNGAEGFWTSLNMDWMIYASHEASITFGGSWLIEAMKKSLPLFDRFLYKGWDLANYDRKL